MGLSASQARLLSITARITDNELRSQFITNAKMRLATESSDASTEYMSSLNATQLMFSSYDATGAKTSDKLTAGLIMTYSPLKNQYGLINNSGQLMVSSTDADNYHNSDTLTEFMKKYDVQFVDNPKYPVALTNLYGDNYEQYNNEDDPYAMYNNIDDATLQYLQSIGTFDSATGKWTITKDYNESNYAALKNGLTQWYDGFTNQDMQGIMSSWASVLGNLPASSTGIEEEPSVPDLSFWNDFLDAVTAGGCWNDADEEPNAGHESHIFPHLFDEGITYTASNGTQFTIPSVGGTGQIAPGQASANWTPTQEAKASALRDILWNPVFDTELAAARQALIDLMADCLVNGAANGYAMQNWSWGTMTPTTIDVNNGVNSTDTDWHDRADNVFHNIVASLNNLPATTFLEEYPHSTYAQEYAQYEEEHAAWQDAWDMRYADFELWLNNCQGLNNTVSSMIEGIPAKEIPSATDPKAQWYTNLWYRMGGTSETTKQDPSNNFTILDDDKMSNAAWLQYALETGVVALEQVVFSDNGSGQYPGLTSTDWKSCSYDNISDVTRQDDTLAVSKAEAKYQKALNDIQTKDKKYDLDLKKLDTQHNALQTEFDSVKTIISKNVERSFKAFS